MKTAECILEIVNVVEKPLAAEVRRLEGDLHQAMYNLNQANQKILQLERVLEEAKKTK